jgi:hypothetical protein
MVLWKMSIQTARIQEILSYTSCTIEQSERLIDWVILRLFVSVFVLTCWILFGSDVGWATSPSDDKPGYELHYKISYERNLLMQSFKKRGPSLLLIFSIDSSITSRETDLTPERAT